MKRNMVPLLGIAFVVAIISTGIFYGLFAGKLRSSSELPGHSVVVAAHDLDRGTVIQASDLRISEAPGVLEGSFGKREEVVGAMLLAPLKANEPLLAERLVSRVSPSGGYGSGMVPSGMRAVSVRVIGSDGLLSLLRPGARVDLQAVSDRDSRVELRNILQNVEVLSVTEDAGSSHGAGAIVTVLTHAQDADAVALADAGAKIRVALRNPFDEGTTTHHAMALSSLFSNQPVVEPASVQTTSAAPDGWDHPIQLHVQVLNVTDAALEQLRSGSVPSGLSESADPAWRLVSFRSGQDAVKLIESLRTKQELEVVSGERLMAGLGRPVSYRAGADPFHLRVEFSPQRGVGGTVSLRVKPEISSPSGSGIVTSRYDAGLPPNASFLLERGSSDHAAERLFPGRAWEHRHLVIFVAAYSIPRNSALAAAETGRGR
ncbi:MAG TPA: Flp pilus assembly protein CpaB [Bryobacteraceae bacterium]|nr:Flp pilus assembly protein CpaB [Bryobacteraceae bacterium]